MRMESYDAGVPCWVDLDAPDPQQAADFYGSLFGWTVEEQGAEAGGYRMAMVGDAPVAGIGPQQNPGPPVWSTYVKVTSANEVADKVAANGGQVLVPPMDVLDVGRMGVLMDPAGAVISVWEPRAHPGAGLVNEPGTYSWSELLTTDVEGAKAFYGAVFGWGAETHGDGPHAYTEWQVSGRSVAGMMQKPPEMPAEVPPLWTVYFAVADTDATIANVVRLGGAFVTGPMDIEPGRFAVVSDPAGALFNVIQLNDGIAG